MVDNDDAKNEEFSTNIVERPVNDNDTDDVSDEQEKIKKMHEMKRKAIAEHANNLNALDYEDTVAGLKTRFKYRTVEKDAYGLSTEEILTADDKLLGQYVPLKNLHLTEIRNGWPGGKHVKNFGLLIEKLLKKLQKISSAIRRKKILVAAIVRNERNGKK